MRFVRGSHGWGLLDDGGFYRQDLDDQRDAIPVPDGRSWEEVPALLPAGGASFHHCLTFHGSGPNLSAGPRRSLAIHMRTENSAPVDGRRAGLTAFIDDPGAEPRHLPGLRCQKESFRASGCDWPAPGSTRWPSPSVPPPSFFCSCTSAPA